MNANGSRLVTAPRVLLFAVAFWSGALAIAVGAAPPATTCIMDADTAQITSRINWCPGKRVEWTWENDYRCFQCGEASPYDQGTVKTLGLGVCTLNKVCAPFKISETHRARELTVLVRNRRHLTLFDTLTCTNATATEGYHQCSCPQERTCDENIGSPLVLSIGDSSLSLTSLVDGVLFDLDADGTLDRTAWTAPSGDDGLLFLDRNGNGRVDDGKELFGEFTPQPETEGVPRNGFAALALFDRPANGGNGDGFIGQADRIFAHLRLWTDTSHDGISSPDELRPLGEAGVDALDLTWTESRREDQHGNQLRLTAPLLRDRRGTWRAAGRAWDVYFVYWPGAEADD
jgi:hypothetical protein